MIQSNRSPIQNYKGYLKEAALYSACLVRSMPAHLEKFVIFGVPRSGTELLVSLLDSHPQIHCEGELWKHKLLFPERYLECRAKLCREPVFGFKLLVAQVEIQRIADSSAFIRRLHEAGYRIISLRRRNLYRAALSSLYGAYLGRFFLLEDEQKAQKQPMTLDAGELVKKIQLFEDLSQRHQLALADTPRLELSYEDDLLDVDFHQASVNRVCAYLGLPPQPISTHLVKMASEEVSDFVTNAAEIQAYLRGTPYAAYLETQ